MEKTNEIISAAAMLLSVAKADEIIENSEIESISDILSDFLRHLTNRGSWRPSVYKSKAFLQNIVCSTLYCGKPNIFFKKRSKRLSLRISKYFWRVIWQDKKRQNNSKNENQFVKDSTKSSLGLYQCWQRRKRKKMLLILRHEM